MAVLGRPIAFGLLLSGLLLTAGCSDNHIAGLARGIGSSLFQNRADVSQRAASLPYASVDLAVGRTGGLLVLSELNDEQAYWQTANRQTIVFSRGYLDHTAGLSSDLLATRFTNEDGDVLEARPWEVAATQPVRYILTRRWRDRDGEVRQDRAEVRMECDTQVDEVELPLTTLGLNQCKETLTWGSGQETTSTLWVAPDNRRIWAMASQPWPGAQRFEWQVARPWW